MWQLGNGLQEVLEKGKKMKWNGLKPKVVGDYVITVLTLINIHQ
jgi:hypothetical protein